MGAVRERAGDVPRPRPRHVSLRHVEQPGRRRHRRRRRRRAAGDRARHRDREGVRHPRRQRPVPDRAVRRRRGRRPPRRARARVRHEHRPPAPAGLARPRDAQARDAAQHLHRARDHQARRALAVPASSRCASRTRTTAAPATTTCRTTSRCCTRSGRSTRRCRAGRSTSSGPSASRTFPPAAARLRAFIEEYTGVHVSFVSVGPARDQCVVLPRAGLKRRVNVLVVGSGGREHALAWALTPLAGASTRSSARRGTRGWPSSARACAWSDAHREPGRRSSSSSSGRRRRSSTGSPTTCGRAAPRCSVRRRAGARLEGSKAWMKEVLDDAGVPSARHGAFDCDPGSRRRSRTSRRCPASTS